MDGLSGQSIAIASYIDPVVAVLVSVVLLNEPLSISDTAGAVMIIGAAIVSEVPIGRKELQK